MTTPSQSKRLGITPETTVSAPSTTSLSSTTPPAYELLDHDHSEDASSTHEPRRAQPDIQAPPSSPKGPLIAIIVLATTLTLVLSLNIHGMLSYVRPPDPPFPHFPEAGYTERAPYIVSSIAQVFLSIGLLVSVAGFTKGVNENRAVGIQGGTVVDSEATAGNNPESQTLHHRHPLRREMEAGPPILTSFFAVIIYIIITACNGVPSSRVVTFMFVVFWGVFAVDFVVLGVGRLMLRLLDRGVQWIVQGTEGRRGYVLVSVA